MEEQFEGEMSARYSELVETKDLVNNLVKQLQEAKVHISIFMQVMVRITINMKVKVQNSIFIKVKVHISIFMKVKGHMGQVQRSTLKVEVKGQGRQVRGLI